MIQPIEQNNRSNNRLHRVNRELTGCQPVECLYTRYSQLSNRLSNRLNNQLNNRLHCVNKHSTGCQAGVQPADNRLYRVNGV